MANDGNRVWKGQSYFNNVQHISLRLRGASGVEGAELYKLDFAGSLAGIGDPGSLSARVRSPPASPMPATALQFIEITALRLCVRLPKKSQKLLAPVHWCYSLL